ncbi:hypothetical protein [Spiroplasma endosymbiont of Polydrusus formosus]|uniref:hypothetical protein n=1 Tax=Spiroplasma endosymbiont of Polydrusus formosus TaxID=3139326 RepID=UPI0035B561BE
MNRNKDNKWYIVIVKKQNDNFFIIKFNFSNKSIWDNSGVPYHIVNGIWYLFKIILLLKCSKYEPETPKIDKITGKITDWKEIKRNFVRLHPKKISKIKNLAKFL